ncbi:hypothetical protein [Novosphingobium humi]|uniref:Uncharacterized protein n=1 Tax=Novosphingobium humi TaxID=2282397 RepID=A0ABY7TWZ6_9SPHN|nr:hypothetical protein [Novosphingobium humi]WCT77788.1 hypothetical protein PQ457_02085 [Novosphingobium humi]WJS98702.1 hypothetical protein NYQ05_00430 [Novosphingobium humi]
MVDFIGDILSDFVAELIGWLFRKLSKPVRFGCLTFIGLTIVGLLVWVFA